MTTETYASRELPAPPLEESARHIGGTALLEVGRAAQSYYDADDHFMGKAPGQANTSEYRLILSGHDEAGKRSPNKAVGSGETAENALLDALEGMRTLESVSVPSLVELPINKDQSVAFTALEHYAPRMAPRESAHPIPGYLEKQLRDDTASAHTYNNTVKAEGWQRSLTGMLTEYLTQDTVGQELAQSLKISSLQSLTPEQAVKLSLSFVQDVSKYSQHETFKNTKSISLTSSDKATSMDLLSQGMEHKDDPDWSGNGICRNVASNVKSVFEALKTDQGELSMLRNTYCVIEGSEAYDNKREDIATVDSQGHAWNKFVTVDAKGSSTITITDATWALSRKPAEALKHMDYTLPRAAVDVTEFAISSEQPRDAFEALDDYYKKLLSEQVGGINSERQLHSAVQLEKFVLTEYLKAAQNALPTFNQEGAASKCPDYIINTLYDTAGELEAHELQTVFALESSGWMPEGVVSDLLAEYVNAGSELAPRSRYNRLLVSNDELQDQIFSRLGRKELLLMAEADGRARGRVRELKPNMLPAFNPEESAADAKELQYFAEKVGIHERGNPRLVVSGVKRMLKKNAPNEAAYNHALQGLSDYDVVRQASKIRSQLLKSAAS